jgi:hypothetical protein
MNRFKHSYRKGHMTMGKLTIILIVAAILALAIAEMAFNILEWGYTYKHAETIQVCQMPDLPRANAACEY